MDYTKKSLSTFFKRTIFKGLENIDVNELEQRKSVYAAAMRSLSNVHQRNAAMSQEEKVKQTNILEQLIDEIEEQIAQYFDTEPEILDTTDGGRDEPFSELSDTSELGNEDQPKKLLKSPIFLAISAVVLLTVFVMMFVFDDTSEVISSKLELPRVVEANQDLFSRARARGAANISLLDREDEGILYEVDSSDTDQTNRFDVIFEGKFAEQYNAINEPILVNFHIKKLSKEDINIRFSVRGSGKYSRKTVTVADQNANEYFLITNPEPARNKKSTLLIRLQISPIGEKFTERPSLMIEKIVFSKI